MTTLTVTAKPDHFQPAFQVQVDMGRTLAEIVAQADVPEWFWQHGCITINGNEIARDYWHVVRPKAPKDGTPLLIELHPPRLQGSTFRRVFAIIATIALVVVTAGIATFGIPGIVAGGTFAAHAIAAGVGIVGQMAIRALTPPPVAPNLSSAASEASPQAGITANMLSPMQGLPAVLGTMIYSPPHLIPPFTRLQGEEGIVSVHGVVGLAGQHLIEDVTINGLPADDVDGFTYLTKPGAPDDGAFAGFTGGLLPRIYLETAEQQELSNIRLAEANDTETEDQTSASSSDPEWHYVRTRGEADEFLVRFVFPAGIFRQGDEAPERACIPIRFQFRQAGESTWINGPELHFSDAKMSVRAYRKEIEFRWWATSGASSALTANDGSTPQAYWRASPSQSFQYTANSYFNPGSGNYPRHVQRIATGYRVYLVTDTFPRGEYEFRFMRGSAFRRADFTPSSYSFKNGVGESNFFTARNVSGTYRAAEVQERFSDRVTLENVQTYRDEYPFNFRGNVTMINFRAKAMMVNSIAAKFTRIAANWDGSGWANEEPTRNPAALYRHVLTGRDNPEPTPESLIDDDELAIWYEDCENKGYECNAIVQDMSVEQVLQLIASAGWAVPRQYGLRSVIRERDRSNETIVQMFTPLNSSNFTVSREFPDWPHAIRTEFVDEADEYRTRDTWVYADGQAPTTAFRFESITYAGMTNRDKVRQRALFDLRQMRKRMSVYTLDVGPEVLISGRGDLVGVTNDVIERTHYYGLIEDVVLSADGTEIIGVSLQSAVDMSWATVQTPGMVIRKSDGTILTKRLTLTPVNPDDAFQGNAFQHDAFQAAVAGGFVIGFHTPFAYDPDIQRDCLVSIGPLGHEYRRCIIFGIEHKPDFSATLTLVDEAPDMWPVPVPSEDEAPEAFNGRYSVANSVWQFVGRSAEVTVSSGNITLNEPNSAKEGDLLICCIAALGSPTFSMPSGMSQAEQVNGVTSAVMGYRVRGGSTPSLTFNRTSGGAAVGYTLAFRKNRPSDVLDDAAGVVSSELTTVVEEGVTTTVNDALVVLMGAQGNSVLGLFMPFLPPNGGSTLDPGPGFFVDRGFAANGASIGLQTYTAPKVWPGPSGRAQIVMSAAGGTHAAIVAAFKPIEPEDD